MEVCAKTFLFDEIGSINKKLEPSYCACINICAFRQNIPRHNAVFPRSEKVCMYVLRVPSVTL